MGLYSYSTNIIILYVSRFIQAVGSSFMWISAYSIAVDIADNDKRGSAIGQIDGAHAKGALYGTVTGFIILSNFTLVSGWSFLFKGYAILSIIAGYIVYKHIPETITVNNEKNIKPKVRLNSNLLKLLIIAFICAISSSMITPLIIVYLQDKFTTDIGTLATAFIPAALIYAFLPSKLGGFSDKVGRIIPMTIGLIGADIVGEKVRGSAYGIYLFVTSLGAAIGPLLGGWLYEYFGHATPFYLNGGILLADAVLVILLFKNYKEFVSRDKNQYY